MKTVSLVIALLIFTTPMFVLAEDNSATISEEQYRKAIASFGVSNQAAETASKEAVRLVKKQRFSDTKNKNSQLTELPANWLENASY